MNNNDQNKGSFNYTYSAKDRDEVERIREKYVSESPNDKTNKMEQLRKLDSGVTKKGRIVSLIIGIIGTFAMGIGMCCAMVWMNEWFVWGIVIGVVGIALIAVAYPIYTHITKKERAKIAPEIIRLTDELINK